MARGLRTERGEGGNYGFWVVSFSSGRQGLGQTGGVVPEAQWGGGGCSLVLSAVLGILGACCSLLASCLGLLREGPREGRWTPNRDGLCFI